MASERRDQRLLEKALEKGKITAKAYSDSLKLQRALEEQGVKKSLVEILEDDGAVTRSELEAIDDEGSLVGQTLGGFQIEEKIGEGGMGAVYRAKQISLGRPVALKVLAPQHARDQDFVGRFLREARAAARLNHPHVVQPLEIGNERGWHFFAMEYCEGGSVASRLDQRGRFTEKEALEVIRAIGLALAYAGDLGMIHRDVKPDNILFTKTGIPKLADLGLAKDRSETSSLTMTGLILGTPNYMSPEQALARPDLDIRTDIYALGITLFEMLTGKVPYKGNTPVVILNMHVNEPLPDPRKLAPISDDVYELIKKMTAKRREERFPTAKDLVAEVERIQAKQRLLAAEKTRPERPAIDVSQSAKTQAAPLVETQPMKKMAPQPAPGPPTKPRPAARERIEAPTVAEKPPSAAGPAPPAAPASPGPRPRERIPEVLAPPLPPRKHRARTVALLLLAVGGTVAIVRPDLRERAVAAARGAYAQVTARRTAAPPPAAPAPGTAGAPAPRAAPAREPAPPSPAPAPGIAPLPAAAPAPFAEDAAPAAAGALAPAPVPSGGPGPAAAPAPAVPAAPPPPAAPLPAGEPALLAGHAAPAPAGVPRSDGPPPSVPLGVTTADLATEAEAALRALLDASDAADRDGDFATAAERLRAALAAHAGTDVVRARRDALDRRLAILEAFACAAAADFRAALVRLDAAPGAPPAFRADVETAARALDAIVAGRAPEAAEALRLLVAQPSPEFQRAAADEAAAMLALAAATAAADAGDHARARDLAAPLAGDLAKTDFVREREAARVRDLLARIEVEPGLANLFRGEVKPLGQGRYRLAYAFGGAGLAAARDLLHDWRVDRGWRVDERGLYWRGGLAEAVERTPAALAVPFRRLELASVAVSPEHTPYFSLSIGSLHVFTNHREGKIVVFTGALPDIDLEELGPREQNGPPRRRAGSELPADAKKAAVGLRPARSYDLHLRFGAALEVLIDREPALTMPPPAEDVLRGAHLELRLMRQAHVGGVALEGAPDWVELARRR